MSVLKFKEINDTQTIEGRYLITAIALLTLPQYLGGDPQSCLDTIHGIMKDQFDEKPLSISNPEQPKTFQQELAALLNRYSLDAECQTADYILAELLDNNIEAYKTLVGRIQHHQNSD